jgi:hypothetical protein
MVLDAVYHLTLQNPTSGSEEGKRETLWDKRGKLCGKETHEGKYWEKSIEKGNIFRDKKYRYSEKWREKNKEREKLWGQNRNVRDGIEEVGKIKAGKKDGIEEIVNKMVGKIWT